MIFAFILLFLCVLYVIFLYWCIKGWTSVKNCPAENFVLPTVTVVVACRNEEKSIVRLLRSLSQQNYPKEKLNVIIVDDHSEDNTIQIINEFISMNINSHFQLHLSINIGKKHAIDLGIKNASGEIILTTDADCSVGKDWIHTMVKPFAIPTVEMVAGPVVLAGKKSLLGLLQQLEMIGLTGISGGAMNHGKAMMCNGANLSYRRKAYLNVKGFSGNTYSSGDDTQLMQKLSRNDPASLFYQASASAIVRSEVQNTLHLFWQQRRRWATKIPFTLSLLTVAIAILAWFVHVGLFIQMLTLLIYPQNYLIFLASVFIKVAGETLFLKNVSRGLGEKSSWPLIFILQPVYWLYIAIVGAAVPFSNYQWKGRKVK